jgi:hypothetical protein
MRRRIRAFPQAQRYDRKFYNEDFWAAFLAWEHEARRRMSFLGDHLPWQQVQLTELPDDHEDDHDDRERQEEVPAAVPYDGDAHFEAEMAEAIARSNADEAAMWPELEAALQRSAQEAEERANLPPAPPLPVWAPVPAPVEGILLSHMAQIMADQPAPTPATIAVKSEPQGSSSSGSIDWESLEMETPPRTPARAGGPRSPSSSYGYVFLICFCKFRLNYLRTLLNFPRIYLVRTFEVFGHGLGGSALN